MIKNLSNKKKIVVCQNFLIFEVLKISLKEKDSSNLLKNKINQKKIFHKNRKYFYNITSIIAFLNIYQFNYFIADLEELLKERCRGCGRNKYGEEWEGCDSNNKLRSRT